VTAVPDAGCCGWENERSDRLLLVRDDKVSVLYDGYDRYDNRDYDVSFYVKDARLADDGGTIAYQPVEKRADTLRQAQGEREKSFEIRVGLRSC